ncbi:unnamed protein product [Leptidea sinapis]|uniref:Gustatory receptor n=1 Tax=Leptidea sinapis TaxID=189913 RepID=A0A5E4R6F2_9NEOP|nr:unnamed protein product [Leptidea sinapis]
MAIEQYTNQLDINVSLGVRISKPLTLESAIMGARQEPFYNGSPTSHFKQKDAPRVSQQRNIPSRNFIGTQPQHHQPSNFVNGQNMSIPPTPNFKRNSGNFRKRNNANFRQFNVPHKQVTPKISSDVTMWSVSKQYAAQNVFYTQGQPVYGNECHSNYNEGEYPYHLISTNYTQPDNENAGILILTDAIDRKLKQFHIRSTPGLEYRVDNRSKTVIKDVFIPINNTEQEIILYKQVAKTARNDKTKPVFKGPYKIIHLHLNNVAEIIGNHPNSKSITVHFKLLRIPHLVSGSTSQEQSCSQQPPTTPLQGYEQAVYFMYSFIFLVVRSLSVSLIAAQVHTASLAPAQILYDIPSSHFNIEMRRLMDQIHGTTVALSGLQFFQIKRGLVLTIAGTIVTYELVLLQFSDVTQTNVE